MDRKEMQNTRLYLLAAFLVLALVAYLFVLYDVQVIHHDDYAAQAIRSIVRTEKVEASRGIITDRNGKPLVSNRSTYDLTFDAALIPPAATATRRFSVWSSSASRRAWPGATTSPSPGRPPIDTPWTRWTASRSSAS